MSGTSDPFFIYINDVPCKLSCSESQMVGADSCLLVPRQFLKLNEASGDVLLRDVTGNLFDNGSSRTVADEVLHAAASRQGFLLLPDPVTGLVRVERYHFYQTVRFVGEHLLLTGSFTEHAVVPPSTTMADADVINSLTSGEKQVIYKHAIANEMLGFARYLVERSGGAASIPRVTSDWQMLSTEDKLRYCREASEAANLSSCS